MAPSIHTFKDEFFGRLKETLLHDLRKAGFSGGSAWKFRRRRPPYIDGVWVQTRSDKKAACVNLGVHLEFLPLMSGRMVDPAHLDPAECEIQRRLAEDDRAVDQWWNFGDTECDARRSADELNAVFSAKASAFFRVFEVWPGPLAKMSVHELESGAFLRTMPNLTIVRSALLLARVHVQLGDLESAKAFAEFGLKRAASAAGPRAVFKDILSK